MEERPIVVLDKCVLIELKLVSAQLVMLEWVLSPVAGKGTSGILINGHLLDCFSGLGMTGEICLHLRSQDR